MVTWATSPRFSLTLYRLTEKEFMHKILYHLPEIDLVADKLLTMIRHPYVLFEAPMGAGKTTLIGKLIEKLSPQAFLGSPTFSLVNEYLTHEGEPLYHFDLYRLKSPEELLDIGFEEYLDQARYVFIEWPERAREFMPVPHTLIRIEPAGDTSRILQISNS